MQGHETSFGGGWWLLLFVVAALPLSWLAWRWGAPSWQQLLNDLCYVPVFLTASLLCFLRSSRSTGRSRRAWTWMAFAPLSFGLGESIWAYYEVGLRRQPFPSLADLFFLIQPLVMGAGLLAFPRAPLIRLGNVKRQLDVAIIMGAVLVLAWFGLGRHIVNEWQGQPLAMWISLAYPVLDVWLLTILLWNFLHRRKRSDPRPRRHRLLAVNVVLALSVLCAVFADVGFVLNYGGAAYTLGNLSDLFWTLGACALGLAALMRSGGAAPEAQSGASQNAPASRSASPQFPDLEAQPSGFNRHLGVYSPYAALSCCFLLLFLTPNDREGSSLLIGTALVAALVACRQLVNHLENEQLNVRLCLLSQGLEGQVQRRTAELEATSGALRQLTGELDARVMERTAQLEASQVQLAYQTRHDALTGLPNRSLFEERLNAALLQGDGTLTAVLYLNLDGFKAVNDRFGHAQGDELLRELARRLGPLLRRPVVQLPETRFLGSNPPAVRLQVGGEMLGRCGGDEFVLAFSHLARPQDAESCARRVAAMIAEGFVLQGETLSLTASLGVSLAPTDGMQAAELIRQADMAMSQAKASGKDGLRFYAPQMNQVAQERGTLERRLRLALAEAVRTRVQAPVQAPSLNGHPAQPENGLRLVYQPQFLLQQSCPLEENTGRQQAVMPVPCSFEALLRWTDAELGAVSPAVFIPVAEDSGLIVPLGHWVLEQACAQLAQWPGCRVAVNVAAAQFEREDFVPEVRELLARHALEGACLELELTERQVVSDLEGTSRKMHELRELGVQVALDDFGVGQSALGHLLRLPVGVLKVDRMFVQGLNEVVGAPRVLQAIVALAHALDIRVVAEGVETLAQLRMVRDLGCDLVQGYLTGRPLGVQEATRLLALPALLPTDPAPAL